MKIRIGDREFDIKFNLRLVSTMCADLEMGLLEIERSLSSLRVDVAERFIRVCVASVDPKAARADDLVPIADLQRVSLELYEGWSEQVRIITGLDQDLESLGGKENGSTDDLEPATEPTE